MNPANRKIHPAVPDLHSDWRHGKISRRDFLRSVTLLGLSASAAYMLAGCTTTLETLPPPAVKRGGDIRIGSRVQSIDHPARLSWIESANQLRQVAEYLTETGPDNLTRPWLLDWWETDDDVKTWTLRLKEGIHFNNGQELTADDLIFNFQQWLDPDIDSSMLGLLSYLDQNGIEKIDQHTIRLHLNEPQIGVPEHLFHYPAMILPHTFEGDFIKSPVGTGPFKLLDYVPGEQAILQRRDDYWQLGADGQPLPYLDELIYLDLVPDNRVAALQGGVIDTLFNPRPVDWQILQDAPDITIHSVSTAQTFALRMRVDEAPWQDVRVRQALKLCQDRQKLLDLAYFGQGDLAIDAHIAPIHPAYCQKPIPEYNPEKARALLAEAGYPDGLTLTLTTKDDEGEPALATTLKELAAPGGFDLQLNIIESDRYWEQWKEVNLGITTWAHRPLGTMVLALAYIADTNDNPVPWNETRWVDQEFTQLLRQAERTLDVRQRHDIMCQLEEIMQDRGPIGISFWRNSWTIIRSEYKNIKAHPTNYDLFYDIWKDT